VDSKTFSSQISKRYLICTLPFRRVIYMMHVFHFICRMKVSTWIICEISWISWETKLLYAPLSSVVTFICLQIKKKKERYATKGTFLAFSFSLFIPSCRLVIFFTIDQLAMQTMSYFFFFPLLISRSFNAFIRVRWSSKTSDYTLHSYDCVHNDSYSRWRVNLLYYSLPTSVSRYI
jgi:hypothetical protein